MGMKVDVSLHTAQRMVSIYRTKNFNITGLWRKSDLMLDNMVMGHSGMLCPLLSYDESGVHLPNGMKLRYPMIQRAQRGHRYMADPKTYIKLAALRMAGEPMNDDELPWSYIYGGKVVENFTQAVARIIIAEQMLALSERYPVVLQVHDELVFHAPESEADDAVAFVTQVMSTPPKWAPDLPVACEAGVGLTYGDAK
jgi:DNA polymerase